MTDEQLKHYLAGGIFEATYDPKDKSTVKSQCVPYFGTRVRVWQNMEIAPIHSVAKWEGQHRFNAELIYGWFPEEDIHDIEIVDEFIDYPKSLPQYMYRLTYTKREKIKPNFGNGYEDTVLPMVIGRDYSRENDEYVMNLGSPIACRIEKAVWNGEKAPEWEVLYTELI
jgi:hypothetical protein